MPISSGPTAQGTNLTATTITITIPPNLRSYNIYLVVDTVAAPGFAQNNQITHADGRIDTIHSTLGQPGILLGRGSELVGKRVNADTIIGKRVARAIKLIYSVEAGDQLIEKSAVVAGLNPTLRAEYFDTYINFI